MIDDTATTKEVVITGLQLWQSQRFNREESSRDFMYKKIRHGRGLKWFLTPWSNL